MSADLAKRDPPRAVQKATDLCTLEGDYDYKEMVGIIGTAVRKCLVVDDLNPLWSHDCFLHHMQHKYPPEA